MIIVWIMIPLVINVDEGPVDLRQSLQLAQQVLGQIVAEKTQVRFLVSWLGSG